MCVSALGGLGVRSQIVLWRGLKATTAPSSCTSEQPTPKPEIFETGNSMVFWGGGGRSAVCCVGDVMLS